MGARPVDDVMHLAKLFPQARCENRKFVGLVFFRKLDNAIRYTAQIFHTLAKLIERIMVIGLVAVSVLQLLPNGCEK